MNKIYLGDAYELIKQVPDHSIDLIYTDIPYLLEDGGMSPTKLGQRLVKKRKELKPIMDGIDYSIFDEFARVCKGIYVYIWCSTQQMPDIMNYFVKEKKCRMNVLTWCKTNPAPMTNGMWLPDTEYCLLFKEKGTPRYNDGYDLKHKWYVSGANKEDKDNFIHPTIKPLELVKKHLKHSSNEGDVILDPFAGSGTTLKAAKDLNRQYIGFEIDEQYYKIAKDRLENINAMGEVSLF